MSDLRKAFEYAAQCWYADGMVNGREYGELADALLAVLADPVRRLAILKAMGLEEKATTIYHIVPLRPRGEATDA